MLSWGDIVGIDIALWGAVHGGRDSMLSWGDIVGVAWDVVIDVLFLVARGTSGALAAVPVFFQIHEFLHLELVPGIVTSKITKLKK